MLKKLIAIDYGKKRIGLASGQTITKTANPLKAISAKDGEPNWIDLDNTIKQWKPTHIVLGLPIDAKGEHTEITKVVLIFQEKLAARYPNIPVHLINEAYTTREARWQLEATKGKNVNHIKVDSLAACIILESWMENNT